MRQQRAWREFGVPLIVLAISLAATFAVAAQLRRSANAQDRERFHVAVEQLQDGIRDRLQIYVAVLRAGAGVLGSRGVPTADEFHAFTNRLELPTRYPGIQGLGFSARIPPDARARLEAAQREAGTPDFQIWPGQPRDEYHAILHIEPMDRRNRAALGYDMFTDPTRRSAMERARDSGEATASGPVTLVQEIDDDKQTGFLIYVPVYDGGSVPATLPERREQLRGFVFSAFRADDLFAGLLGRNARSRAGFALFDDGVLVHRSHPESMASSLRTSGTIDVAGRQWTADYFATPVLTATSSSELVPIATFGGIAVSLLLSSLAWLETRARARAEQSEAEAEDASRRFQQLANSIPQLAWMARPDGWIYWYNERWYEYTGTTPEQMTGWGWQQVHDPETLPAVIERWRHSLQTGTPFEMEFALKGADGRFRLFLTRVVPLRDSTGTIVHWFGTNTDVQYRHDADRSLQEHADTLAIVNRTGIQLAAELDLERLVQAVTDAGTRLTKAQFGAFFYNTTDARGEAYTLYTLSGVPREAFARFPMPRKTAVFGPTFDGEGIVRADDITEDPRYGKNSPYSGMPSGHLPVRSYLAAPVKSRSGQVLGGLFFGHAQRGVFTQQSEDIVAGVAAQAAIAIDNARLYKEVQELLARERAARAEAERVSRMKDEFLATLSHELRTPLNAVVGWAHMLNTAPLNDDKRRHAIETILRNARVQSQLIEDLLDMSRIISGRLRLETSQVDVAAVIDAAITVVRQSAEAKRVTIATAMGPERSVVHGDANRLQQVIWNLLSNAIKFTPPGGRVEVALTRLDELIEVAVSDTGIGIEPGFLQHVFERFRQADGSFTRGHGGLGLGLSIVRSLVELHGGTIRADSAGVNQGARFTITLPLAVEPRPGTGPAEPVRVSPVGARRDILSDLSVVVVDDDRDSRELACEVLREHGARVQTAASAPEALELFAATREPADVLVCDLGMPEMDGYELIRRLRERGLRTPAVALTAYAGAEDQSRAIAAGFDLHLAKPFRPDDLVAACTTLARPAAH